jgi:hypothetical protein
LTITSHTKGLKPPDSGIQKISQVGTTSDPSKVPNTFNASWLHAIYTHISLPLTEIRFQVKGSRFKRSPYSDGPAHRTIKKIAKKIKKIANKNMKNYLILKEELLRYKFIVQE